MFEDYIECTQCQDIIPKLEYHDCDTKNVEIIEAGSSMLLSNPLVIATQFSPFNLESADLQMAKKIIVFLEKWNSEWQERVKQLHEDCESNELHFKIIEKNVSKLRDFYLLNVNEECSNPDKLIDSVIKSLDSLWGIVNKSRNS